MLHLGVNSLGICRKKVDAILCMGMYDVLLQSVNGPNRIILGYHRKVCGVKGNKIISFSANPPENVSGGRVGLSIQLYAAVIKPALRLPLRPR